MPASPWPMPGVSTMTRSKPAALHAAITSCERVGHLGRPPTGGQRAEEHLRRVDRVHADAVAEQRAAARAAGRVDGEHRDAELVLLVEPEAADQLVGERRLARPAGAGDAEHRARPRRRRPRELVAATGRRERPASMAVMTRASARAVAGAAAPSTEVGGSATEVDVALAR